MWNQPLTNFWKCFRLKGHWSMYCIHQCFGKTVTELLCLDAKQVDLQLADEKTWDWVCSKEIHQKKMKNPGKQKECSLGIRSFFTTVISYLQKSLELNNTLVEAMQCLHPGEKEKATSIQKIRALGKELPYIKPEDLTVLTDEWRMYAEAEIPDEWLQDKGGKTVELTISGAKFFRWEPHMEVKSSVCWPKLWSVLWLFHMGMLIMREACKQIRRHWLRMEQAFPWLHWIAWEQQKMLSRVWVAYQMWR